MSQIPPAGPLSEDDLADFARDGFVVKRALFGRDEMREIRAWVDEAERWDERAGAWMMYFEEAPRGRLLNRLEDFVPYHAGLSELTASPRLCGAVGQLFGEPAVLFKEKINFKLPGGGGFEPHQDAQAGWSRYAPVHLTALLAIDTATPENGCLEIAAGRFERLIGREWEPLGPAELDGMEFRPLEAEPGDVVFFDSFVPHRSGPNESRDARRVLYCTYNAATAGDHRRQYYSDKRASYPPDIEREAGKEYRYRV